MATQAVYIGFWVNWAVAPFLRVFPAGAGLATARIQLENNEVLAAPVTCGWIGDDVSVLSHPEKYYDVDLEQLLMKKIVMSAWGRWVAFRSLEYVRKCYNDGGRSEPGSTSTKPDICGAYTVPRLNISVKTVDCPFNKSICTSNGGYQVEIGPVDTNKHIGINGNTHESITIRKTITCAPILTDNKFSTPWTHERLYEASFADGDTFKYYRLGAQSAALNYTWVVNNSSLRETAPGRALQTHRLAAVSKVSGLSIYTSFEPAEEVQVSNSDITVVYLVSNARYSSPVKDPWFSATSQTDQTGANRFVGPDPLGSFYISDRIASALGCKEQYQFCTPGGVCSKPSGAEENITTLWRGLDLGVVQQGSFNVMSAALAATSIGESVSWLGSQILRTNDFLWSGDGMYYSTGLPTDQWMNEVRNFAQFTAAARQTIAVIFATAKSLVVQTSQGPIASAEYLKPPLTRGEKTICDRIRVRNAQYTSFSVAGITITLLIGAVIIILDVCVLPRASFWICGKIRCVRKPYPEYEWCEGYLLMQQKRALELKGLGPWEVDETTGVPWLRTLAIEEATGQEMSPRPRVTMGNHHPHAASCAYEVLSAGEAMGRP